MLKGIMIGGLLVAVTCIGWAEVTITGELTTIATLGNADPADQTSNIEGNGIYKEGKKNGFYTAVDLNLVFKPVPYLEGYLKITGRHRPGSLYVPLGLESVSEKVLDIGFDTVYGKAQVFEALGLRLPLELFVKGGKFKTEASSFQKVSKYQTESVLAMMKTANTPQYELEGVFHHDQGDNPFKISGAFTSTFKFDEAVERLYDTESSPGAEDYGMRVLDKYDPSLFASLKLQDFMVKSSPLSAEVVYAYNGAEIYSGSSLGFSLGYTLAVAPDMKIPLGLGFAYYEKNIDALSKTTKPNDGNWNTTGFRDTCQVGFGGGLRYNLASLDLELAANLGTAYTYIEHLYWDPLSIFSLSLDAQITYRNRYFLGAGFIAGYLGEDQEQHGPEDLTLSFSANYGVEVYGGIRLLNQSRLLIGFNMNRGIAMNHTLETKAEGQIKYRQKDTESSDLLLEIGGLYIKLVMTF